MDIRSLHLPLAGPSELINDLLNRIAQCNRVRCSLARWRANVRSRGCCYPVVMGAGQPCDLLKLGPICSWYSGRRGLAASSLFCSPTSSPSFAHQETIAVDIESKHAIKLVGALAQTH